MANNKAINKANLELALLKNNEKLLDKINKVSKENTEEEIQIAIEEAINLLNTKEE